MKLKKRGRRRRGDTSPFLSPVTTPQRLGVVAPHQADRHSLRLHCPNPMAVPPSASFCYGLRRSARCAGRRRVVDAALGRSGVSLSSTPSRHRFVARGPCRGAGTEGHGTGDLGWGFSRPNCAARRNQCVRACFHTSSAAIQWREYQVQSSSPA